METLNVAVLPGGRWGTAFAKVSGERGHQTTLGFHTPVSLAFFLETRQSKELSGIYLPENIKATSDFCQAVDGADIIILAPPSAHFREVCRKIKPAIKEDALVLILTKGLEEGTNLRMSQILVEEDPSTSQRLAVLSGPNFAREVAIQGTFSGATVASTNPDVAKLIQRSFSLPRFRIYTSDDPIGVEVGGLLKNVIAIAMGASDGKGMGENARSFLMTRGLVEMRRLGKALGAKDETFLGLSGVGDVGLSGTSMTSRNYRIGYATGYPGEESNIEILKSRRMLTEGIVASKAALELARKYSIEMPITEAVYDVFYGELTIDQAMHKLLKRELTQEIY